jgi:hypothetical protein
MPDPVPTPSPAPKPPLVNLDALVAFGIAEAAFVGSVFPSDPHVALVCQLVGGTFLAAAVAFHLDGK